MMQGITLFMVGGKCLDSYNQFNIIWGYKRLSIQDLYEQSSEKNDRKWTDGENLCKMGNC